MTTVSWCHNFDVPTYNPEFMISFYGDICRCVSRERKEGVHKDIGKYYLAQSFTQSLEKNVLPTSPLRRQLSTIETTRPVRWRSNNIW